MISLTLPAMPLILSAAPSAQIVAEFDVVVTYTLTAAIVGLGPYTETLNLFWTYTPGQFGAGSGSLHGAYPQPFQITPTGSLNIAVDLSGITATQIANLDTQTYDIAIKFGGGPTSSTSSTSISGGTFDVQPVNVAFTGNVEAIGTVSGMVTPHVSCFLIGTRIATPDGDRPVEQLRAGQLVLTSKGTAKPIRWIGRRQENDADYLQPELVWPVRIRAGAFADLVPRLDVRLSPDHAVYVEDSLVPISQLLNGITIAQEEMSEMMYFHVELENHEILLAEGLPVESYRDGENRRSFDNAPERPEPSRVVKTFADRATPSMAEAIWHRLATRAASCGKAKATLQPTGSATLRLLVGTEIIDATPSGDWLLFDVPPNVDVLHFMSQSSRPSDLRPWLDDRRRLGVAIGRILVRTGAVGQWAELPIDQPSLLSGWWPIEYDGARVWRWTNGAARLAIPPLTQAIAVRLATAAERVDADAASA